MTENRQILQDNLDVSVICDGFLDMREDLTADAAAIIYELDHGHVTVGIAARPAVAVIVDLFRQLRQHRGVVLGLIGLATLFQLGHGLDQDLGVFHQIAADGGAELFLFRVGHRAEIQRKGGRGGQQQGGNQLFHLRILVRFARRLTAKAGDDKQRMRDPLDRAQARRA